MVCLHISCSTESDSAQNNQTPYFNLSSYFKTEARALQDKNPFVLKKVGKNEQIEQKKIQLDDWEKEFELFASSDINKSDWLQSYRIDSMDKKVVYQAKDPKLRTKQIIVYKNQNGSIKRIQILNSEKNWLYQSFEQLNYYPDSLYQIAKEQSIRIIGQNNYLITGKIL